ncbi:hypothetical protein FEM48_Zijuj10G0086400 [Ziziphus jujuba var. spinosa]|uniref:GCK domain-containing protein n=1 Tax=Ziziphus jujuba var. spinosa TaxID=714518 RepID=A0A978UMD3_ZIZJJ|nr:hypothetical protein FEM48_Zijuj10G0086400 [Ziziphus jujuba var. spinosa]
MGGVFSSNPSDTYNVDSSSSNSKIPGKSKQPNSSQDSSKLSMSSTDSKTTESLENSTLDLDPQIQAKSPEEGKPQEDPGQSEKVGDKGGEDQVDEGEDEEEGECGFCLFMKGGGCKESFEAWEQCMVDAEKNKEDVAQKCFEITGALKKCMEAHSDYYEPLLKAEKAAEEEAIKELEREKEREAAALISSEQNAGTESSESQGIFDDNKRDG